MQAPTPSALPPEYQPGPVGKFFSTLFQDCLGPTQQLVVWCLRPARPGAAEITWHTDIPSAERAVRLAEAAQHAGAPRDVYFGVSLQDPVAMAREAERLGKPPETRRRRGYSKTARVLPGFFADIDYGSEGHKGDRLPRNEADALGFLEGLPKPPSVIVHSGGGLQAYWLFETPLVLASEEINRLAERATHGWYAWIESFAEAYGYHFDHVKDLARVLRPPGTHNHKYGTARPVRLLRSKGPRYAYQDLVRAISDRFPEGPPEGVAKTPEEVDKPLIPAALEAKFAAVTTGSALTVELSGRIEKLCELDDDLRKTWARKRARDFGDDASRYDLSLASILLSYGLTPQETVNALEYFRQERFPGRPVKNTPEDYYRRTLRLASSNATEGERLREAEQTIEAAQRDMVAGSTAPPEVAENLREQISTMLKLPPQLRLEAIIRYPGDPPHFALRTNTGTITLGDAGVLLSNRGFQTQFANLTSHVIPTLKDAKWKPIAQSLLLMAETADLGDFASPELETWGWLRDFLAENPPAEADAKDDACAMRAPFKLAPRGHDEQLVHVFPQTLQTWLRFNREERLPSRRIAVRLKMAGLVHRTVGYRSEEGRRSTASAWAAPVSEFSARLRPLGTGAPEPRPMPAPEDNGHARGSAEA